jgi:hypothetical protein
MRSWYLARTAIELSLLADDAQEMCDLGDHAASLRRVRQLDDAADLVELEPDQGQALVIRPAYRAANLLDGYSCHAHARTAKERSSRLL